MLFTSFQAFYMMLYAFVKSFLLVTIHMVHLQPQMANNTLMLEFLFSYDTVHFLFLLSNLRGNSLFAVVVLVLPPRFAIVTFSGANSNIN